jgi:DNA-directed RNA polymerase specialized sigma24 family protein
MKEMLDLLPQERTIYVPARSEALAHNNDCPIEAPIVSNVLPETLETFSETGVVDLRDLMDACCESDAERACLRLREEGYTFQEISDRLGLSLAKVFRMFGKLKARILGEWTRE